MGSPNTIVLWKDIHEIAQKVCKEFGLTCGKIIPETQKLAKCYGQCYPCETCQNAKHINERNCKEKTLSIRIHQLNKPRVPLATSTILDTLAHELAHLRIWEEGPAHQEFVDEILEYMKGLGYKV